MIARDNCEWFRASGLVECFCNDHGIHLLNDRFRGVLKQSSSPLFVLEQLLWLRVGTAGHHDGRD